MTDSLKHYCQSLIDLTTDELPLIDEFFEPRLIQRNALLLADGAVCRFIAFIVSGSVRHFHVKNGDERTCDISFDTQFITDFNSFSYDVPSTINLQALQETTVLLIRKERLVELYQRNPKFEKFGRLMAEKIALRATDMIMSLSSEKPAERYQNLLIKQPDLAQRVPQKYIANLLGISPESLSRIRKRLHQDRRS